ncbi:hypothetical protein H7J71_25225 [Mycolicibacterium peregrinum]|uniref:hypothetical protein n=1 Tax=Mycolicibacterium peregrinum TaxID=43304 RepID=UPI000A1674B1|nr:hypothetical protein [Mycolicibacterium peregrinum]ORW54793.1 hypothetical protein AWC21_23915 [Mycolicibacterium peregrinum]
MTNPLVQRWRDLDDNMKATGINIGTIDKNDRGWNLGGFMAGRQGAIITGPVSGMVHHPFKSIWHEPAYGPPRFERTVDERREISTRITLMSDDDFGWFDTESLFWDGVPRDEASLFFDVFTRAKGQLYIPMMLLDAVETPLENDPTMDGNNMQEWDILLAADGDPAWQMPDLRPPDWVNDWSRTTTIKPDDNLLSTPITVGVGKIKVANRSPDRIAWPVITVSAPGRCWISNGATNEMIRVPKLNPGEHVRIDTDPSHRIAISDLDPMDNWTKRLARNSELLSWLFGEYGESGQTILERFHGQGFSNPIQPGTVATITVFHSQENARVGVRLPQRYERAIS